MADKSSFTPDEWKLILEGVMMASVAVTAAEPSGLWGLLKGGLRGRHDSGRRQDGRRVERPDQGCRR